MDWISIGLGALSGGLAAMIASIILRLIRIDEKKHRVIYMTIFMVTCLIFFKIFNSEFKKWNNARQIESAVLEIPLYRVIKEYEPVTYNNIVSVLKEGIRKGLTNQQIAIKSRPYISAILFKRIPYASDDAIISLSEVILLQMNELKKHNGDLCYRLLFPQKDNLIDYRKYFSKKTKEAEFAAMTEIIKTSALNPQSIPDEAEVMLKMKPIFIQMAKEYGKDILMLQNPTAHNVDKGKICVMTEALYRKILKLPKKESSEILRFWFSQE